MRWNLSNTLTLFESFHLRSGGSCPCYPRQVVRLGGAQASVLSEWTRGLNGRTVKPQVWEGSLSSSFLLRVLIPSPSLAPLFYSALLGVKKENSEVMSTPCARHQRAWSLEKLSCSEVLVAGNWWGFLQECDPVAQG